MALFRNSSPLRETPANSSRLLTPAPTRRMIPAHHEYRPAEPHQSDNAPAERLLKFPGMLSLNIYYQHKKLSLCMSNCRSIEVTVIYPAVSPDLPKDSTNSLMENPQSQNQDENQEHEFETNSSSLDFKMPATQEQTTYLSSLSRDTTSLPPLQQQHQPFRLLDLPLELRLKIYTYLLPPRAHKITTQIPHNGYFYNTSSTPLHSATSFYPFGPRPPPNLTTYKVLSSNFHNDFPKLTIHAQLFRVCKQVKQEAEPLLYGAMDAVWDFGTSLEAVAAFWGDRSMEARGCVRGIRVAREVPNDGFDTEYSDRVWENFCSYIAAELRNLRTLDLTIWSSSGSITSFPSGGVETGEDDEKELELKWREWDWISGLLEMQSLRNAKVTWWGFQGEEGLDGRAKGFDSWLGRRMMGDKLVRDRVIREGVVVEGTVVLTGGQS